jgi:hypothetical protein
MPEFRASEMGGIPTVREQKLLYVWCTQDVNQRTNTALALPLPSREWLVSLPTGRATAPDRHAWSKAAARFRATTH